MRKYIIKRFGKKLLYIMCFVIITPMFYLLKVQHIVYKPFKTTKDHGNFVTFISSKTVEEDDALYLEGYFDNVAFGEISVLRVKNLSFLSEWHKQKAILERENDIARTFSGKTIGCPGFYPYLNKTKHDFSLITRKNFPDWKLFEQNRRVENLNCKLLFEGNEYEQINAMNRIQKETFNEEEPFVHIKRTSDCAKYIKTAGYITSSLTVEEENFPIAYSILVYKSIYQVETLLRSIYRPQNVYCIHCDKKADPVFREALYNLAACFENVFVCSKSFNVVWGTVGVLLPEIACMKDLWKHKKWKYFINLTGQEFPLRTNLELVKILKIYNGANDMEGTVRRVNTVRWKDLPNPPYNIRPVKGSVHIAASRGFVSYVLHSKVARDFFNWSRNTGIPDETFFSSLNHNSQLNIPGSYKGEPETTCETKPFLTRFKNWGNHIYNWPCHGTRVRLVCVFGIGDLPLLASRPEMFANKFYTNFQPYAYKCMDELIFNRTRDEYFNVLKFDTSKYKSLEFIKHVIK